MFHFHAHLIQGATAAGHIEKDVTNSFFKVSQKSDIPHSEWEKNFKPIMSNRKRAGEDIFFSSIGYSILCVYGHRTSSTNFLERQREEEQAVFWKHFHVMQGFANRCNRDFSYQRFASYYHICHEDMVWTGAAERVGTNDKCFRNNTAPRTYRTISKCKVIIISEGSLLSFAWLHVVTANIMDSLSTDHGVSQGKHRLKYLHINLLESCESVYLDRVKRR